MGMDPCGGGAFTMPDLWWRSWPVPGSGGGGEQDVEPGSAAGHFLPPNSSKVFSFVSITTLIAAENLSGLGDELVTCIAYKESEFNPSAKNSTSSASGLMQLTKGAVKTVYPGLSNAEVDALFESGGKIFDAAYNIRTASAYLAIRVNWASGNVRNALAGYGTGPKYADKILECEEGLKGLTEGEDPYDVLEKVR